MKYRMIGGYTQEDTWRDLEDGAIPAGYFIWLPFALAHSEDEPSPELGIEQEQQLDLCSYLKDVQIGQGVTQAEWDKTCQPLNAAELIRFKAQTPEKFSAYLQAMPSRKAEIQKVYEALKNKTDSPQQQEATAALLADLRAPINERTFPAWYPQDSRISEVYHQWLVGANEKLTREKEDKENPISEERHQELDALLARNQSQLDQIKGLKDKAKFRCAIGENCAERSEISAGPGSVVAQSPAGRNLIAEEDKRPYKLPVTISGRRIDHGVPNLKVMGREVLENSPFPIFSLGRADPDFGRSAAGIAATAALTATGAFLLLGGLGGKILEEKYPNIRRNMGIAAAVSGAVAVGAMALPTIETELASGSLSPPGLVFAPAGGGGGVGTGVAVDAAAKAGILVGGAKVALNIYTYAKSQQSDVDPTGQQPEKSNTEKLDGNKSAQKWQNQLSKRGWTPEQIEEAREKGQRFPAPNKVNPGNGATRYVHPLTGRSVVVDNVTNEVIHVGGDGFKY